MKKPHLKPSLVDLATRDSFQNFLTRTGVGTGNANDGATYGFNPVSRNRIRLENCYRGSWVAGVAIDAIAEDMTREGVEIQGEDKPDDLQALEMEVGRLQLWPQLCETIKWSRLYGGSIGYLMIDGQSADTPLRLDSVSKGQFRGILPLDRWMAQPSLTHLVTDLGPDFGKPKFYEVLPDAASGTIGRLKIHYSRVIRLEGVRLPYWQRVAEMLWGQSVLERLWDRMTAFDSTTAGAAQLVYKAHLRTYKIDKLRDIIATGGAALEGLVKQIQMIRAYQSNEGLTLMDKEDEFEAHQYTFSGLDDVLLQFGQQLSGATGIPLVRLFGQSPAGLNSTGEADLRTYYDNVHQKRETDLRPGVEKVYGLTYRSLFGRPPPKTFSIVFAPLWQLSDEQKADITNTVAAAIVAVHDSQITKRATALRELKQLSHVTGYFSNISDEEIAEAESDPAPTPEALGLELPVKPAPNDGSEAIAGGEGTGEDGAS